VRFESDPDYREQIAPNVWLMDDHRWAFWCWEEWRYRSMPQASVALAHIDFHWDGIWDVRGGERLASLLSAASSDEVRACYHDTNGNPLVDYASFIAPAIVRGLVKEVHFLCRQTDTERGLDPSELARYDARQYFHASEQAIVAAVASRSFICDLDLDYFNEDEYWYSSDGLWPRDKVLTSLTALRSLIAQAEVVTIAMSFGHSGKRDDAQELAQFVTNYVLECRGHSDLATHIAGP
jgi:uncharacterized protein UPF0489